jgi:hypothetical protein
MAYIHEMSNKEKILEGGIENNLKFTTTAMEIILLILKVK